MCLKQDYGLMRRKPLVERDIKLGSKDKIIVLKGK